MGLAGPSLPGDLKVDGFLGTIGRVGLPAASFHNVDVAETVEDADSRLGRIGPGSRSGRVKFVALDRLGGGRVGGWRMGGVT